MDTKSLELIRKVWKHSGVKGNVWMPQISNIGVKGKERFREGSPIQAARPHVPDLREDVDWYWTPAVTTGDSRLAKHYGAQRVLWVDCDDSYNDTLLTELRPTYIWETSPGHKQAIWLLEDSIGPQEFSKDGLMGLLTQSLGADKSGVDIPQLLRVPGTYHHKRETFKGRILRSSSVVHSRGELLSRVARGLGFSRALASEIGADDPWGDRSVVIWKISRTASELGLPQDLTFKLLKACKWNKWPDNLESLKADIATAYNAESKKPEKTKTNPIEDEEVTEESVSAWDMSTVNIFGPIMREGLKWVLPGVIQKAGVGLIVAGPKVGKTRVAMEIALGIATGKRPLGIRCSPQAVGFFSLEDGEYLFADRLNRFIKGTPRDQYHWDGNITRNGSSLTWEPPKPMGLLTKFNQINLSKDEDKQRLHETILRYELKLVIIDTLSMAIGDHNVSDQKEMNSILKDVRSIARETGCAVMFIHHTRKRVFEKGETIQETILGATALHAWCEFVLSLASPEEDSNFLRLGVQTKMGNDFHYFNSKLKIIKQQEEE